MQGYVGKDRRAPHRREADEELAQRLQEQNINAEEPVAHPEEQTSQLLIDELLKNDRDFQTVVKASKVLIDINEPLQASEMLADCITFLARRWKDRYPLLPLLPLLWTKRADTHCMQELYKKTYLLL